MLPSFVIAALEQAGYESPYYEKVSSEFREHWGNLEIQAFIQALKEGQGVDKLLAIFVVGGSGIAHACDMLLPVLQSSIPLERWASALCLGKLKEERAISTLITMLDEFLPPNVPLNADGYMEWRYDDWRCRAARLVGEWERPDFSPVLLRALSTLWQHEQALMTGQRLERGHLQKQWWYLCQKELVYALGQLHHWNLVRDLVVPRSRLNVWMIYLALGYLKARDSDPAIFQTVLRSKVVTKDQILAVIGEQMHLSQEELGQCWLELKAEMRNGALPLP